LVFNEALRSLEVSSNHLLDELIECDLALPTKDPVCFGGVPEELSGVSKSMVCQIRGKNVYRLIEIKEDGTTTHSTSAGRKYC
jgi:hypothetical protein